jgi:prolyl oligopeptidase
VLLDPNTLAEDGTVSLGATAFTDDGTLMAYTLSDAGSDVATVQVKVVATGEDLPDRVEWLKFSGVSWRKDASGFFYSSYGVPKSEEDRAQALKSVGSFHKVYFHKLGTPQSEDVVVFERPDDGEMLSFAGVSEDGRWLVVSQGKGSKNALAAKDLSSPDAPITIIAAVDDAIYEWIGNQGTTVWMKTTRDAPKGKIVRLTLGDPEWQTVVAEQANSLESATMVHGTILAGYLVDAQSDFVLYTPEGTPIEKLALPGIGLAGVSGGKWTDDETFFMFTNYTTPPTVYRLDMNTFNSSVWKAPSLRFDPNEYITEQVFAASKDGTRVPLFVTARKTVKRDGSAPTLLYGYGGFNVSLGPAYASSRLAWMEMGGIYAEAILRGGGEYGEAWHEAGTKLRKQNVFDDFIACAEHLIANGYTSPKKLAINGGSNGGLLVAACELQRPELFGAAIAQVGVLDMLRFDKFTIGYAWKPDYGSPSENEEEFHAILKYSPLHNVKAGAVYPATLITTADHDDRVFPAHSFKYAAALQAAAAETPHAAPVLIRIETRAGHGAGMPLSKQMDVTADMYAFLVKELGMEDAGQG